MATVVAAKLGTESSSCAGSSDGIPAVHRLQMAVADTECAQALLELAMSIVPNPPSPNLGHPYQTEASISNDTTGQNQLSPVSPTGASENLRKRQADSPIEIPGYGSTGDIQYRAELLKCIRLDHNYSVTADDRKSSEVILEPEQFKTYCETIKQNGSVPVSIESSIDGSSSMSSTPGVPSSDKENSFDSSKNISEVSQKPSPQSSSVVSGDVSMSPVMQVPVEKKNQYVAGNTKSKSDRKSTSPKQKSVKKKEESISRHSNWECKVGFVSGAEVKETCDPNLESNLEAVCPEGEEKFHNFQLLLKCLVANEPQRMAGSPPPSDWVLRSETPRTLSMSSEENDERPSSSTSDCEKSGSGDHAFDYPCKVCKKIFSKKRYLTKHVLRMHPLLGSDQDEAKQILSEESITCPYCHLLIRLKKDLQRHVVICRSNPKRCKKPADIDLANCQFCGIRMRRPLLVRHLADQHCVDPEPKDSGKKGSSSAAKTVTVRSLIDDTGREKESLLPTEVDDVGFVESSRGNVAEVVLQSLVPSDSDKVIEVRDDSSLTGSSNVPVLISEQICHISADGLHHKKANTRPATLV